MFYNSFVFLLKHQYWLKHPKNSLCNKCKPIFYPVCFNFQVGLSIDLLVNTVYTTLYSMATWVFGPVVIPFPKNPSL